MLTNPVKPLAFLAVLSLVACGGGAKTYHPMSSVDISGTIRKLAANADTAILGSYTPLTSAEWTVEESRPGAGFQDVSIFSTILRDLGEKAGVHRAEAMWEADVPPGPGSPPGATRFDYRDYAGWMHHSLFYIKDLRRMRLVGTGRFVMADGALDVFARSIGRASDSRPVSGGATWNGIMAGVDVSGSRTMGERVEGSALLVIPEFDRPAVDVTFSDITYTATGFPREGQIEWNGLAIDDAGMFGDDDDGIRGRFYGPDHEEVGGVFLEDGISGAFGASR
ncbi:MAG: transferrin-binding protein-like solute binding protein [Boseongicola sp. SB0667_bin_21]|nr:transferrin-binding protein-like solute binding protein [Boseongicola sp. SB0667_bin_21]